MKTAMIPHVPDKLQLEVFQHRHPHADATPALFVHGYHEGAWFFTETLMPYFYDRGYDTFALNLRGHGRSERHQAWVDVSFDDYRSDLKTTIHYVCAITGQKPILIGHSMGGMLVQDYIQTDELPAAVVLSNGDPAKMGKFFGWAMINFPGLTARMLLSNNPDVMFKNATFLHKVMFNLKHTTPESQSMVRKLIAQNDSSRVLEDMRKIRFTGKKGGTPVLMVAGSKDPIALKASLRSNALKFEAVYLQIRNKRHDITVLDGWQETAGVVENWLAKNMHSIVV